MADDLCSTQVASGPLADLGYAEEVCLGDIPVDPQLKTCRRRSTTLALSKDSYSSEEVRSDRMVSDSRHGIRRVAGDIVTELSPGSHADFMEALLGGVWMLPAPVALSAGAGALSADPQADGTITFTRADLNWSTTGLRLGDTVSFNSTTNVAYDGKIFTLIDVPAGVGEDAVAIPNNTFMETATASLAAGQMRLAGARADMGNIYRSFTFERAFTDIGSFLVYTGCRFNQMAVDLPPTGIATATYSVLGQNATPISNASIDGVDQIVLTETTLTTLSFNGTTGEITAGAGSFLSAGIEPGDRVIITGDGITDYQNRNPRTVIAVTATKLTVAEAIQTGGPYAGPFTVTRVGLPDYTLSSDESVLVAVSGVLLIEGQPAATVTAMSFTINNQMAGSDVVGSNVVPVMLYGNQCLVTGSMTVLFDRGGAGEKLYNAFDLETDNISIIMRLESADGGDAITFNFPRCKISSGTIGDAVAEGLPVSIDFTALKPHAENAATEGVSQVSIVDTAVTSGVAPFVLVGPSIMLMETETMAMDSEEEEAA